MTGESQGDSVTGRSDPEYKMKVGGIKICQNMRRIIVMNLRLIP